MLKSLIEYLIGLGNTRQETIGSQIFTTQPVNLIKQPTPATLCVRDLSGLVDYIKNNFDAQLSFLIHVSSPTSVSVYSSFNRDMQRNEYIEAKALLPEIPFSRFLDLESFNILLQSCFVDTPTRSDILRIVGNVKEENVANFGDDGVTQSVTAKSGIATVENVPLPNPVYLKPFRTFVEIEQPESAFVFRMKSGPTAALFEADGGAWKLTAIEDIKQYLLHALSDEIENEKVTIIA